MDSRIQGLVQRLSDRYNLNESYRNTINSIFTSLTTSEQRSIFIEILNQHFNNARHFIGTILALSRLIRRTPDNTLYFLQSARTRINSDNQAGPSNYSPLDASYSPGPSNYSPLDASYSPGPSNLTNNYDEARRSTNNIIARIENQTLRRQLTTINNLLTTDEEHLRFYIILRNTNILPIRAQHSLFHTLERSLALNPNDRLIILERLISDIPRQIREHNAIEYSSRSNKKEVVNIGKGDYKVPDPLDTCAICLEEIHQGEGTRLEKDIQDDQEEGCNHVFHDTCLSVWINKPSINQPTCPVCRAKIFKRSTFFGSCERDLQYLINLKI
jgi:hypothetical protein